jgi:hypothetical protein
MLIMRVKRGLKKDVANLEQNVRWTKLRHRRLITDTAAVVKLLLETGRRTRSSRPRNTGRKPLKLFFEIGKVNIGGEEPCGVNGDVDGHQRVVKGCLRRKWRPLSANKIQGT